MEKAKAMGMEAKYSWENGNGDKGINNQASIQSFMPFVKYINVTSYVKMSQMLTISRIELYEWLERTHQQQ